MVSSEHIGYNPGVYCVVTSLFHTLDIGIWSVQQNTPDTCWSFYLFFILDNTSLMHVLQARKKREERKGEMQTMQTKIFLESRRIVKTHNNYTWPRHMTSRRKEGRIRKQKIYNRSKDLLLLFHYQTTINNKKKIEWQCRYWWSQRQILLPCCCVKQCWTTTRGSLKGCRRWWLGLVSTAAAVHHLLSVQRANNNSIIADQLWQRLILAESIMSMDRFRCPRGQYSSRRKVHRMLMYVPPSFLFLD